LEAGEKVMFCRNVDCKKLVPFDSLFCPYCGGREFSKEASPSGNGTEPDELSMENFQKIIESTDAVKEKTVQPKRQKPSLNSRFAVRMNSVGRKLPAPKKKGWRPGQAARKRNFFVAVFVAVIALFFVFQSQSNPAASIKSAAVKVLPGSEAYKVGYEAGRNFKSNVNYNDEFINQWIPEGREMLDQLGQSSQNMTEDMVGDLADAAWPLVALKVGIMENSPENRADFRRGMINGYFG
jgi:hypothetical protein